MKAKPSSPRLAARRCDRAFLRAEGYSCRALAIALEDAEAAEPAVQISPPATGEVRTNIVDHEASTENVAGSTMIAKPREGSKLAGVIDLLRHEDEELIDQLADPSPAGAIESPSRARSPPRSGTKLAQVTKLLQRDDGATIDELIATTGWLAHTTRAALTGLRKRGYAVTIDRSHKERGSIYRVDAFSCDLALGGIRFMTSPRLVRERSS